MCFRPRSTNPNPRSVRHERLVPKSRGAVELARFDEERKMSAHIARHAAGELRPEYVYVTTSDTKEIAS